jgi:hypothetical protein
MLHVGVEAADVASVSSSVPPPGYEPPSTGPLAGEDAPAAETDTAGTQPSVAAPGVRQRSFARSRLLAGGLGIAAAAGLAFVLLGSSTNQLADPIAQAATLSSRAPGYRMHMTIDMSSPALPAPITASGGGVVDLRDHAASMTLAMNLDEIPQAAQVLGSTTMSMRMIMAGDVFYIGFPRAVTAAVPNLGGKPWIRVDLAKLAGLPGLSSLESNPATSDPRRVLDFLRAASNSVQAEGHQQVDGLTTTHYRAELSFQRETAMLPPADQAAMQQMLSRLQQSTGTDGFPIDVWIDGQHLVRRIVMTIDLHLPTGPSMQEVATIDLGDYGPQPQPTPPPSDQVQDLGGLIGGAGSLAGGSGGITVGP